jgi:hypothetical protein
MQTAFGGKGGGGRVVTSSHDVLAVIVKVKEEQQIAARSRESLLNSRGTLVSSCCSTYHDELEGCKAKFGTEVASLNGSVQSFHPQIFSPPFPLHEKKTKICPPPLSSTYKSFTHVTLPTSTITPKGVLSTRV